MSEEGAEVIVVTGVSGVGKTTLAVLLAERLSWEFAEGDRFHPPANVVKMSSGTPLDDADRMPWLRVIRDWISAQVSSGINSVVTCSALKRAYRDELRHSNPSVRFLALTADVAVLSDRTTHRRQHFMPPSLLRSQLESLEPLAADEPGTTVDASGPPDLVVQRCLDALGLAATS